MGRPKSDAALRNTLRDRTPEIVARLFEIMNDRREKAQIAALRAAELLLAYGHGRPTQTEPSASTGLTLIIHAPDSSRFPSGVDKIASIEHDQKPKLPCA